jgi:hypothetical protein
MRHLGNAGSHRFGVPWIAHILADEEHWIPLLYGNTDYPAQLPAIFQCFLRSQAEARRRSFAACLLYFKCLVHEIYLLAQLSRTCNFLQLSIQDQFHDRIAHRNLVVTKRSQTNKKAGKGSFLSSHSAERQRGHCSLLTSHCCSAVILSGSQASCQYAAT